MSMIKWVSAGLLAALIATPALALNDSSAKRLARFEAYAGKPVAQMRYFRLINFATLSDDTVAVWTGVSTVFLIKVLPPCQHLPFAKTLSLTNSMTHVFTQKFDFVVIDHDRCSVASIRPVDYKAMRAARKKADQSASGAT